MLKIILFTAIFLFISGPLIYGQQMVAPNKYKIQFRDKNNSNFSLQHPEDFLSARSILRRINQNIPLVENDLPVSHFYEDSLEKLGLKILTRSKWFNSVVVYTLNAALIDTIGYLSFVKPYTRSVLIPSSDMPDLPAGKPTKSLSETDVFDYGNASLQIEMLNGQVLHNYGFQGQGMLIAVLDAGFYKADTIEAFDSLFINDQIPATWDFVDGHTNVYDGSAHGMNVLSAIGSFMPGKMVGTAPKASFLLLRSEDAGSETIIEEENWVAAAEYADSAGADIINSSLGYTTFDYPEMNHTYSMMDGKTAIVSIAAGIASDKGILVVSSAGNEGTNGWHYISAPADAEHILSVGAVDNTDSCADFSSRGPTSDARIKPDVCALGSGTAILSTNGNATSGYGTSFSSPLIAGMAACLWQANPTMTNTNIMNAIIKSADQYSQPDNNRGYGVPDFAIANLILRGTTIEDFNTEKLLNIYPVPCAESITLEFYSVESQTLSIGFYDIIGKKVLHLDYPVSPYLPAKIVLTEISSLSKGVYFMKIQSSGNSYQKRIIKY